MGSKWDVMTRSLGVVVDNSNEVAHAVESVLAILVRTDLSPYRLVMEYASTKFVDKDLHGASSAATAVKATSNETQWLNFIVSSEGEACWTTG
jgi:hypothetical protein